MGLGKSKAAHEIIYYIIKNFDGKLVLDADALNILSENIDLLNEAKCKIILTPHMMEFKRLYDAAFCSSEENSMVELCEPVIEYYENNKLELAKKFIEKYNITLLLKGPTTIVVSSNAGASFTSPQIRFVDRGTPGMSTAGSGDVLSGIITGLLGYIENEFDATVAAAFINGMAGEFAARDEGEISMTASDTVKHISEAIKAIKGK